MSNPPHPQPPFGMPFPFPYPPPHFMPPKLPPAPSKDDSQKGTNLMPPPYFMPPYGMPPYPMMFPPPFMHGARPGAKPAYPPLPTRGPPPKADLSNSTQEPPKLPPKKNPNQQRPPEVIVLSDNEEPEFTPKIALPDAQKTMGKQDSKVDTEYLRPRPERHTPQPSSEHPLPKTKPIEKKKEARPDKKKQQGQQRPAALSKFVSVQGTQPFPEAVVRSKRSKVLTSKQGRARILVGADYQAKPTPLHSKDEQFSIWLYKKECDILSRLQTATTQF